MSAATLVAVLVHSDALHVALCLIMCAFADVPLTMHTPVLDFTSFMVTCYVLPIPTACTRRSSGCQASAWGGSVASLSVHCSMCSQVQLFISQHASMHAWLVQCAIIITVAVAISWHDINPPVQ